VLGHSVSFRDLEELLTERGLEGDDYLALGSGTEGTARLHRHLKPTGVSMKHIFE
jgi:hypothetical protein